MQLPMETLGSTNEVMHRHIHLQNRDSNERHYSDLKRRPRRREVAKKLYQFLARIWGERGVLRVRRDVCHCHNWHM